MKHGDKGSLADKKNRDSISILSLSFFSNFCNLGFIGSILDYSHSIVAGGLLEMS
jgi:hypothetical protein